MIINVSIDIEDEIRQALESYQTAYVRPLPAEYDLPHILITQVGGTTSQTIDTFAVVLDSRARTEAEALYREIGEHFRSLAPWQVYVITSHPAFERFYGKRADKVRKLYNGMIPCYLYQYFMKPKK